LIQINLTSADLEVNIKNFHLKRRPPKNTDLIIAPEGSPSPAFREVLALFLGHKVFKNEDNKGFILIDKVLEVKL
jgi:hypothetical protein